MSRRRAPKTSGWARAEDGAYMIILKSAEPEHTKSPFFECARQCTPLQDAKRHDLITRWRGKPLQQTRSKQGRGVESRDAPRVLVRLAEQLAAANRVPQQRARLRACPHGRRRAAADGRKAPDAWLPGVQDPLDRLGGTCHMRKALPYEEGAAI